jgi:hypothetical protein
VEIREPYVALMTDVANAGDGENAMAAADFGFRFGASAIARVPGVEPTCVDAGPSPDSTVSAEVAPRGTAQLTAAVSPS